MCEQLKLDWLSEVIISPGPFKFYLMFLKYCSFIYSFSNQAET